MRMLQVNVGILHSRIDRAFEPSSKQFRKTKIRSPFAPFIVEARLVCSHNAAAALNILNKLPALRVRQARDIGQHKRLKRSRIGFQTLDHEP